MTDIELLKIFGIKHFPAKEINDGSFGCESGVKSMSFKFLVMCDTLRERLGLPLTGVCWFRARTYDLAKGRSGDSDHCKGCGVDFKIRDLAHALLIVAEASKIGFNAFGINLEKGFVHIGLRASNDITTWNY